MILKKLDALTSLRFFAAVAIVLEHSLAAFSTTSWIKTPIPYDQGVSFFFVLSGFILSYTHPRMETMRDAYAFYVARFARIWPLHIATILLSLALLPKSVWFIGSSIQHWVAISIANVFLVQAWIPAPGYFFSLNAASWSISAEFFFYLMFPVLRNRWATTWHWKALLVTLIVCAILTVSTSRGVPGADFANPMQLSSTGIGYTSPFTRIVEFVTGMLAASAFARCLKFRSKNVVLWTVLEIAALAAMPCMMIFSRQLPSRIAGHDLGDSAWSVFAGHCGSFLAFALVVMVMAIGRGLLSRALSLKPLVLLGEASFALYLVHQMLIGYFYMHRPSFDGIPDVVLCVGYWLTSITAAFALWHFVENPARRKIRALLNSPKSLRAMSA